MANTFAKDAMATLWEEVAETTSINMTLSKDLEVYDMDSDTNDGRNADASGQDQEWIPQEYRFEVQDGIVSTDGDFQDLTDRMIPVRRNKALRILARIGTKDLRDPMRRKKKMMGMAKDIANAVDTYAYQTMIDQATLIQPKAAADFAFDDAIDAEVLMLNRGLGGYNKKLFLSNTDYSKVAKDLGQNQYYGKEGVPNDALTKASIPDLATFDTMRSDYLINLAGNVTAGVTVNGAQSHTVATYDANDFYLDNRSMTLLLTGATTANMPVGTKFTIAGVNALHPETREDTGDLQTFTVKTAVNAAPVIQPAIVIAGPYRNCSAEAGAAAAVTMLNATTVAPSLFYTPESTVIVPGRLPVPNDAGGVESVDAVTEQGLPMRLTYRYDFHNETFECKALIYFDVQVVYPWMLGAII